MKLVMKDYRDSHMHISDKMGYQEIKLELPDVPKLKLKLVFLGHLLLISWATLGQWGNQVRDFQDQTIYPGNLRLNSLCLYKHILLDQQRPENRPAPE